MTGGTSGEDGLVIGREKELARLQELVTPPYPGSQVLVLLGDPGMGKTALLAAAAKEARSAGVRVLETAGRASERNLAFAGLHWLLRPVLDRTEGLAARQADALRQAFGLSEELTPPDALLTGLAVLNLLAGLSDDGPLLVIVDDSQWMDQGSIDALAFAARRLDAEQLVVLFAARGTVQPSDFRQDFAEPLVLAPLSLLDAGRLLERQPHPPRGRARWHVLDQAAGNPLALIELSKAVAADPGAGRRWADEPLPLTARLTAVMAARFTSLPPQTRAALLLAAAADNLDLAATAIPGMSATALRPAEEAGLIRLDDAVPQFTHPLVRAAVYHAEPFSARAAAHLTIASTLGGQADRRAWHLAAATMEPDEQVASLLEETATRAQRRGGAVAAARAMERAAQLTTDEEERARRLLTAAQLALPTGQADWVHDLAGKALTLTSDPDRQTAARLSIGWSLLWSRRNSEALDMLLWVAAEAASRMATTIAWEALGLAATAAQQNGNPAASARVRSALSMLEGIGLPADFADPGERAAGESQVWIKACTDPFGMRAEAVRSLHTVTRGDVVDLGKVGAAAWILDESDLAVRLLREALSRLRTPGVRGGSGAVLSALQWAYIDSGRWDDALDAAREASDIASAYKMETVAASADLAVAAVAAMRGDHDQVAPLLDRALAVVDAVEMRGFAARALQAAGLAALGQGDHALAYAKLNRLFEADGTPVHPHFSYLAIADLAAAAVRVERRLESRALLDRALALLDPAPGPRLEQLTARAYGLTAEPADAEHHFAAALATSAGSAWPFERAQLQLDYGEWLRRQRRINAAKPILAESLETFRRMGAAPWFRRAESELRACGVAVRGGSTQSSSLAGLTAQQREIVKLASQGLSNPEIADRLFLSPRTVASHLYRSFPKLGVSGRHQLRNLGWSEPDH